MHPQFIEVKLFREQESPEDLPKYFLYWIDKESYNVHNIESYSLDFHNCEELFIKVESRDFKTELNKMNPKDIGSFTQGFFAHSSLKKFSLAQLKEAIDDASEYDSETDDYTKFESRIIKRLQAQDNPTEIKVKIELEWLSGEYGNCRCEECGTGGKHLENLRCDHFKVCKFWTPITDDKGCLILKSID